MTAAGGPPEQKQLGFWGPGSSQSEVFHWPQRGSDEIPGCACSSQLAALLLRDPEEVFCSCSFVSKLGFSVMIPSLPMSQVAVRSK